MIRGKIKSCPFGLDITESCKTVGKSIFKMIPVELSEKTDDAVEYNYRVVLAESLNEDYAPDKCAYADAILEKENCVDCKYNESGVSDVAGNVGLNGSPIYPHMYVGNTTRPTESYPQSYYSDDNSRTIYYGLISLLP